MLLFGMSPLQVDQSCQPLAHQDRQTNPPSRWTLADRTYLTENLGRIAKNVGKKHQLLCPRQSFFRDWRQLIELTNLADVIYAMPHDDYVAEHARLREYIRRLPEDKWLEAKKSLPSDLFAR